MGPAAGSGTETSFFQPPRPWLSPINTLPSQIAALSSSAHGDKWKCAAHSHLGSHFHLCSSLQPLPVSGLWCNDQCNVVYVTQCPAAKDMNFSKPALPPEKPWCESTPLFIFARTLSLLSLWISMTFTSISLIHLMPFSFHPHLNPTKHGWGWSFLLGDKRKWTQVASGEL